MLGKSRTAVFFQWFVGREGRKVGLLKRWARRHVVWGDTKNCTQLWPDAHFQVKMPKSHQVRTILWSSDDSDVEKLKLQAAVARSTFGSQNVKIYTPATGNFLKFRCPKIACRCGAKSSSKSKCTRHTSDGPLFEVRIARRCGAKRISKSKTDGLGPLLQVPMTPLWRQTHFQVKNGRSQTTFASSDVEKLHATVAQSAFPSQNAQNTPATDHFLKLGCRKIAHRCGAKRIFKSKC